MHITRHMLAGTVITGLACAIAIPVLLLAGKDRPIPISKLTVAPADVRPVLTTAEHALSPIAPRFAGLPEGNPFVLRERGVNAGLAIPEPPPPPLTLPSPPLTPFAPTP